MSSAFSFRFFVQLTVRPDDPVQSQDVAQRLAQLGGTATSNGFGFASRLERDNAYDDIVARYGSQYVAAGEVIRPVDVYPRR